MQTLIELWLISYFLQEATLYVDYHFMDPSFSINNVSVILLLNETSHELGALVCYNATPSLSQVKISTC